MKLTGWRPGSEAEIALALAEIGSSSAADPSETPIVVFERTSLEQADQARELLESAGGTVELADAWITREEAPLVRPRATCPACGSDRTEPFTYAGPAARVNTRCRNCGRLFKDAG